ncbi:CBS domain containing protein [Halosimplex carlsbadense 2-9-1]|uniref:CBS domain containing protein n=1 Tax=Halosimplex carlsbadense 2-9-1 TaxID=797114 RepID=M0CP93_9EURY|nr:CBS domain-containing protein [Halosimplex carlsbadense]ELZ25041.1 CBS domain containing protein [Halosimplex carlsbadense 2-9-1]
MIETTVETVTTPTTPTIDPETPVTEAAERLRTTEVSALVVLDSGTVVGVVTEGDIVALVAETGERPPVRAIMSTPVTTVASDATVFEAAERMRAAGVKHLPVVDDGVFLGLVSASSLAPYCSRHNVAVEWEDDPLRVDGSGTTGVTAGD